MKVNISAVDLLLLRMTHAVAITLDSNNAAAGVPWRSEEHTSELQSLMRISYAVFCLKKKTHKIFIRIPQSFTTSPNLTYTILTYINYNVSYNKKQTNIV